MSGRRSDERYAEGDREGKSKDNKIMKKEVRIPWRAFEKKVRELISINHLKTFKSKIKSHVDGRDHLLLWPDEKFVRKYVLFVLID